MLQLDNVSYCYQKSDTPAVTDINLTIEKGICFGLLGPNGAGKTTLISLMSGLIPLQSGQIYCAGLPLSKLSPSQARSISLIPQDYAFYPQLTVWENMQFFASLYKISDKKFLLSLLDKVDLFAYKNSLAKTLSGGLKRRLNFAIGLVNSPKIIFMDEITVGVDSVSRQFILDSVKQLTQEGITVIYTSHYLHEIETLCQKIAIIESGQLRFNGDIHSILYQQAQQQCRVTLGKTVPSSVLSAINATLIQQDSLQTLLINPEDLAISSILHDLEAYQIHSVQYGYGSLESFYLDFLQKTAVEHTQKGKTLC